MDEDIEFDKSFQFFPGVDLALWFTIVASACIVAVVVGAVMLVV